MSPLVSIVIPNWNGIEYLEKCITSLENQTYNNLEIIVVDNASTDGSCELVKKVFPGVKVIQMGYNSGWGVACNAGMAASDSEFIALLNNDAYMESNCVAEMVKSIQLDPKYGSCASRILLWDQPDIIEVCGLVIYRDGSSCGRGRLHPADEYMQIQEVFCANDCCCLYRREMIEDIGEYDPDFFIYCDETDIGWRHQLAGWKCIYTPHAIAYHAHSRTAGSYSAFKAFHVERNRIYLCIKYFPISYLLLSFWYSAYRYLYQCYLSGRMGKGALAHYRKNNSLFTGVCILIKAHWAAVLKFPTMWHRRRQMKKIKRISNHEISKLIDRFGISVLDMASYE